MITKESIEEKVNIWVQFNLSGFEFREHQKEAIIDIIYNILNDNGEYLNHCQTIEAPTGSGKSLINIISACVLAEYYGKRSYILASDLYLWQQYYDFIVNNNILKSKIGYLKGQIGNYLCSRNNEDLAKSDCKMAGIGWNQLFNFENASNKGFHCARNCRYIRDRKKAIKTDVTLLTYQAYFYIINDDPDVNPRFDPRDVVFCDECHNIPSIIQMKYSCDINYSFIDHIQEIYNYATCAGLELFEDLQEIAIDEAIKEKYPTFTDINKEWESIWNDIKESKKNDDAYEDFNNLSKAYEFIRTFVPTIESIQDSIKERIKDHSITTNKDIKVFNECSIVSRWIDNITEFKTILAICGKQYLVKQINEKDNDIKNVVYHCAKEDYMIFRSLLNRTKHKVFVSATIGDQDTYEENIGVKYFGMEIPEVGTLCEVAKRNSFDDNELGLLDNVVEVKKEVGIYKRIPSTFDFSKSPIHYLMKYYMNARSIDSSIEKIKPIVYNIIEKQFSGYKGIIQTGNYKVAKKIIEDAPPHIKQRLLEYNGNREKADNINFHKMCSDSVIVGPTLNEGIDLPGEDCRFIIILKMPYPNLMDNLVAAKCKLFPRWYNYITANHLIQGIGRGNRFKDDWCITYILDACFGSLLENTKEQFPKELLDRLQKHT